MTLPIDEVAAAKPSINENSDVVDTSSEFKRRVSSRTRLPPQASESSKSSSRRSSTSTAEKTSTPQTQLEKDAAFARMLHAEDFNFRSKGPRAQKASVRMITKSDQDGGKVTEIRTCVGGNSRRLKYTKPVYPVGTKYFTKVMVDGEVIGRLPSISGEMGSDLAYGREAHEDVFMKDRGC